MPCYSPLQGWRSRTREASGKRGITFNMREGYINEPLDVPCGQCIGCKIVRARQWALRCCHEASLYDDNMFLTLTYEKAPPTLVKPDLQDFFRRMRDSLRNRGLKFRYFGVGEYGALFDRAHYHALIFGFEFKDKVHWSGSLETRDVQYVSEELNKLWGMGYATIGDLTPKSANYVSKYCVKKLSGPLAKEYYGDKRPEFAIMSRRPGIGKGWIDKFKRDVFPRDFVVVEGGSKVAVPRFYLEAQDEGLRAKIKRARLERMKDDPDARGSRAVAKAACAEARIKRANRRFENEVDRI
ncbi:MAG: replication initiator protein [Microviridae sp.]|nr:MAG: replication initiator protein [Microviridae sp.]